jgi:hypothetical protein
MVANAPAFDDPCPIHGSAAKSREWAVPAADGTPLMAQVDLPAGDAPFAAAIIVHHSGAVDRCAYDYLAQRLVAAGVAAVRFDKRGTGRSGGDHGCCEGEDALAVYRAARALADLDPSRTLLIAQSIGTRHLVDSFGEALASDPPAGIVLLSSLLAGDELVRLPGPLLVILADSEPNLAAVGPEAVDRYRAEFGDSVDDEVTLYIAEGAEHTLFDVTAGPIDWQDPAWRTRFHAGAAATLDAWLKEVLLVGDRPCREDGP